MRGTVQPAHFGHVSAAPHRGRRPLLHRSLPLWLAGLILLGAGVPATHAQATNPARGNTPAKGSPPAKPKKTLGFEELRGAGKAIEGISRYTSKHYELYTDLSAEQAKDLLQRLETMLGHISKYWGRPPQGVIEMYVVHDLKQWPPGAIQAEGLAHIEAGAGVTLGKTISDGNTFLSKAVVYAVADAGVPQHEAVHAYCVHAFGRTGPVWYAEGMAEMGNYWQGESRAVNAKPEVIDYLRRAPRVDFGEIVHAEQKTGDSWQNYAWRWALCHLLANNPNYSPRFRPLGVALLSGQKTSFDAVYGPMQDEVVFEYRQFLSQLAPGLRVDLTAWDWKSKFKALTGGTKVKARIEANRGWQPARVLVNEGQTLAWETEGTWKLDDSANDLTAAGEPGGRGGLEGVLLFHDAGEYRLGEPFFLGAQGTWTAPASARLYLRCRDDWAKLADHKGAITVRLELAGDGERHLAPPAPGDSDPETDRPTPDKR
ncbi:MAG: hypothetical protein ACK5TO_10120 [Planctomycetaceae bacterium]